jgi:Domain of unknown function (DUF4111)
VDFLVVTWEEASSDQEAKLRRLHEELPTLDIGWAQHLEGSYPSLSAIRRSADNADPWLYLDNGSKVLERSTHDNTALVRWVLREHGAALAGPEPADFVEPVTAADLRSEVARTVEDWAATLRSEPESMNNAWKQPYVVLSYCRMLHTLASGRVTSKREAGQWALASLAAPWSPLIQRALDQRPDPWIRVCQPGDSWAVGATWQFIDYAVATAARLCSRVADPG